MRDTVSLFFHYSKITIHSWFQYRVDALLMSLAVFLREAGGILCMVILFQKFDGLLIRSWNLWQLIFLYSYLFITYGVMIILFTGLRDFNEYVRNGQFDRFLVRPRGILFQIIASKSDWFAAIGHSSLGIVLLLVSASRVGIHWNFCKIIYYILSLMGGILIQASIFLFIASLSFYIVKTDYIQNLLYYSFRQIAGYPISLFPKILQSIMIYVIPFAFVNYFPARCLIGINDGIEVPNIFYYLSFVLGIFMCVLSYGFFRYSLRHYTSTGN